MLQRLTHEIYFDWWMPAFFPKLLLRGEAMQVSSVKLQLIVIQYCEVQKAEPQIKVLTSVKGVY